MANLFKRTPQGYTSAEAFLKNYEELLKKNKQSSLLAGFDTNPQFGYKVSDQKIANPTGIGISAAQQSADNSSYAPTYAGDMTPELDALREQLQSINREELSPENSQVYDMLVDMFARDYNGQPFIPGDLVNPPQDDQFGTPPVSGTPYNPADTQDAFTITRQTTRKPPQPAPVPAPSPAEMGPFPNPAIRPQNASQVGPFPSDQYLNRQLGQQPDVLGESQDLFAQADQAIANANTQDELPSATPEQVADFTGRDLARIKAVNQGMTPEQMQTSPAMKGSGDVSIPGWTATTTNGVTSYKPQDSVDTQPIRQKTGNLIDQIGTALNLPEMGLSENVAGGNTQNTKFSLVKPAYASGNEPSVAQPGQGVEGIKTEYGGSIADKVTGFAKRPEMSKINPSVRSIGDVGTGGQVASNLAGRPSLVAPDAFFSTGLVNDYTQYLKGGLDTAQQAKGGALDTSLFTDEFYDDPNRVSTVFGSTSMAGQATDKYRAREAAKYPLMGYDGIDDGDYRSQVDAYNQSIQSYLSGIPTLTSDFNYSALQAPTGSNPKPSGYGPTMSSAKPAMSMNKPASVGNISSSPMFSRPTYSVPTQNYTPASAPMSMAQPKYSAPSNASAPSRSAPQQSSMPNTKAPQMSVMPKASAPAKPVAVPYVNYTPAKPQMSVAPKPAIFQTTAKPQSNPVQSVIKAITNIFRRK